MLPAFRRDQPPPSSAPNPAPRRADAPDAADLSGGWGPWLGLIALCFVLFLPGISSLPPFDRDEARFAQASRQMVESGDWVHIRLQDEPRNKKPIGIYWAQAAVASAVERVTGSPAGIWAYRIPSLLGAMAAVLLLFGGLRREMGNRPAFMAASLLAVSLLLGVEAHLAKTDALQLACIVAVQMALLRVYRDPPPGWGTVALFWGALGLGILVKGPVVPMVTGLTLLALWWLDRKGRGSGWMKRLQPVAGLPLLVLVVAPWPLALFAGGAETPGGSGGTSFFSDAVRGDILPKLIGGQEGHGAPPGTYAALVMALFFPGSVLLLPALVQMWRDRAEPMVRFMIAWGLPTWLVFEAIPTKLPHYVLPAYPVLAVAVALFLHAGPAQMMVKRWWARAAMIIWGLVALALAAGCIGLSLWLDRRADPLALAPALVLLLAGGYVLREVWAVRLRGGLMAAVAMAGVSYTMIYSSVLPRVEGFWLSRSAAQTLALLQPAPSVIGAVGYGEPSLVFLTRTDIDFASAEEAAARMAAVPDAAYWVTDREDAAFRAAVAAAGVTVRPLSEVQGYNYSKGRRVTLKLYRQVR